MSAVGATQTTHHPSLDFPDPIVFEGGMMATQIVINRRIQTKLCLYSPTGTVYEIDRKIKECIYGQVHVGLVLQPTVQEKVFSRSSQLVAIKIIRKRKLAELGPNCNENPMKEIAAMQFVGNDHPNVISLIECIADNSNYYSVMEFADGGELFDNVKCGGRCTEEQARDIFSQILNGIEFLHSKGIHHRDMSLENLMMKKDGTCLIIDFGMCVRCPMDENGNFKPIAQLPPCSKKSYLPPEIFMNTEPHFCGAAAEIWSLGTILCMMVIGGPIFRQPSVLCRLYRRFFQGEFRAMLEKWKIPLSEDVVDLIEGILKVNPQERPSIAEIRQHPWLSQPA